MTKLNGSETSYLSKMSIGRPKSSQISQTGKDKKLVPDIGQFITKEQGTVAFCKTDETRFRCAQFLKKSDKIFLLKKKNSKRKITCHRAQTWKNRLKEDNTGVWENISIILYIFLNDDLFFYLRWPGSSSHMIGFSWWHATSCHLIPAHHQFIFWF